MVWVYSGGTKMTVRRYNFEKSDQKALLSTRYKTNMDQFKADIDAADNVNKLRGCLKDLGKCVRSLHRYIKNQDDGD